MSDDRFPDSKPVQPPPPAEGTEAPWFLRGGGISGETARAVAWEQTPLGHPEGWPAPLKTTVATILRARQPMFLWWGEALIQLYNDAYLPSLGQGKHPRAMGQPGRECWPEIWSIIGPQIAGVMERGEPTWHEDALVPIFRNGRVEEVYWTYTYSPVFDEVGDVAGTLVICTETTNRVLSERRTHILHELVRVTTQAYDAASLARDALAVLVHAEHEIPYALLEAHVEPGRRWERVERGGSAPGPSSFGVQVAPHGRAGAEPRVITLDTPVHCGGSFSEDQVVQHAYVVPLQGDAGGVDAYIAFGLCPRLPFDPAYRRFLDQVAAHLRAGRTRLHEAERRHAVELERRNLLEQAPVATAVLVGQQHVFELANPRYREMVGRPDIIGKTYVEAFPELAQTPMVAILDRVFETGEPFSTDEQRLMLDRGTGSLEECFFRFSLEPVRRANGQVYGMMAIALDVTDQVMARRTLEKASGEREQLLHNLEHAMRAKDEFLAMLGHELRNPLSPMASALQLMQLKAGGQLAPELAVLERQVKHLTRLVDDLLDVARIARGKVDLKRERVDVADTIGEAVEMVGDLFEKRRHRLSLQFERGELFCRADPARLLQVVSNLLTNAARHTAVGGSIAVEASQREGEITIVVRDDGQGISPEMLPRVFTLFEQGQQAPDRAEGGLGIGLALVKNLVELHGGRVAAHSEGRGHGSTFTVCLPADAGSGVDTVPPPSALGEVSVRPKRVLVVDDNVDAAMMLQLILQTRGHTTSVANDAAGALALVSAEAPEVAILDIGLPVIDGYELAARLRAQPGCADCKLIALTGYGRDHDKQRSRDAGFHHHLVKPVDPDALLRLLDRLD